MADEKPKGRGNKRVKRDEDYQSASEIKEDEEDEEADDSDDSSKPAKVTITPLPKLRPEGEVDYEDSRVHENTMLFLKDLKKHNNRDWMKCEILPLFGEMGVFERWNFQNLC